MLHMKTSEATLPVDHKVMGSQILSPGTSTSLADAAMNKKVTIAN